jgi:hypothetical protein
MILSGLPIKLQVLYYQSPADNQKRVYCYMNDVLITAVNIGNYDFTVQNYNKYFCQTASTTGTVTALKMYCNEFYFGSGQSMLYNNYVGPSRMPS